MEYGARHERSAIASPRSGIPLRTRSASGMLMNGLKVRASTVTMRRPITRRARMTGAQRLTTCARACTALASARARMAAPAILAS